MSWFTQLVSYADGIADALVDQANAQMVSEQKYIHEEKNKKTSKALLPWEDGDETQDNLLTAVKERILALPLSEKNFTLSPPNVEKIKFSLTEFVPIAMRLLSLDPNLTKIHAKLAPLMNEELFWRNYYYRIMFLRALVGLDENFLFELQKENEIIFKNEQTKFSSLTGNTTDVKNNDVTKNKQSPTASPLMQKQNNTKQSSINAIHFADEDSSKLSELSTFRTTDLKSSPKQQLTDIHSVKDNISTKTTEQPSPSPIRSVEKQNVPVPVHDDELDELLTDDDFNALNLLIEDDEKKKANAELAAEVAELLGDDDLDLEGFDDLGDLGLENDPEFEALIRKELSY